MDFQAYDDGTLLKILVGRRRVGRPWAPRSPSSAPRARPCPPPRPRRPPPSRRARATARAAASAVSRRAARSGQAPAAGDGDGLRASPIARRMADAAGLDLRTLAGTGTGPDGRIVKADVERALAGGARRHAAPAAAAPAPPPAPRSPPRTRCAS